MRGYIRFNVVVVVGDRTRRRPMQDLGTPRNAPTSESHPRATATAHSAARGQRMQARATFRYRVVGHTGGQRGQ